MSINNSIIVIKSNITDNEFKKEFVKKIRRIVTGYNIAFVESEQFSKFEIIQPTNLSNKSLGALANAAIV
jgi:hypothetical protein